MTNIVIDITEENSNDNDFSFENIPVNDFCKQIMGLTRVCQKYSNDLQGWHHYSDYKGVRLTMNKINYHLNSLITKIFNHQDIRIDISGSKLSNQFEILREGNDALLEKVNTDLDEASGIRRNIDIEMLDATVRTIRGPVNPSTGRDVVLLASRNVQKPQLFFASKISNSRKEPFIPPIKEKPHSKKPLSILVCIDKDGNEYYSHPYEFELQHWTPSESLLIKTTPIEPLYLPDTPFLMVDNVSKLEQMMGELIKCNELAIDLEAHQFRSYQGLTCLIQISSREKDYIIDPFPIREKLSVLNDVLTNPSITKVFHGADSDIVWLQRDFGVYVVNMFDTHQAAVVLNYPHRSLAALLHKFCFVNANKTYQRADWRIRPLPEDFIQYARQDSHYLLYVYDELRNELIEKGNELNNLINAVYSRSTEICLKRYEKPIVVEDTYLDFYRRSRKHFNNRQLYALKHLFLWRDKVARDQDESVEYVLPKHMMLQIAEILPKEIQGILACCNPIPTLIKTEQLTLHQIVRAAREQPLTDCVINLDNLNQPGNTVDLLGVDDIMTSALISRHDLSQVEEKTSGMSTLLNPQETLLGDLFNEDHLNTKLNEISTLLGAARTYRNKCKLMNKLTDEFISPFERYKKYLEMKPLMEEESIENEKQEKLDADTQRVNKIREHFLSLSSSTYGFSSPDTLSQKTDSDLDRLKRLEHHIASLVQEVANDSGTGSTSSSDDEAEKPNKNSFVVEQIQDHLNVLRSLRDSDNTQIETPPSADLDLDRFLRLQRNVASAPLKPANDSEEGTDSTKNSTDKEPEVAASKISKSKKTCMNEQLKAEFLSRKKCKTTKLKETENNKPNDAHSTTKKVNKSQSNGQKRKSSESAESIKKQKTEPETVADQESTENAIIADPDVETNVITPFDYEAADYSIFKNKKASKLRSKNMKLKEKFKGKGSTKMTGKKKSGLKSISWGNKN